MSYQFCGVPIKIFFARVTTPDVHVGYWWGKRRERDHLENPGVNGRIILRYIFRKLCGGTNWTAVAQDRDRWRTHVNAVMNFWVP